MNSSNQIELISFLSNNRDIYPHKVSKVEVEETHISWVLLTGKFAYKIKKELKFGHILDFSTLSLRKKFCQREVDLNRVLCGDMYRDVMKVVKQKREQDEADRIKIVGLKSKGKALEYAVKMLENPQKFRMDNLLQEGRINSHTIDELASMLVKFHNSSITNRKIKSFGEPQFLKRKIDENFATLSKLAVININLKGP
jgi:aminoglycoside phosphotransferase family enzyme